MKSFVFWLATAGSLGALAGSLLRPSPPEIVIVWFAVIALHYGWQAKRRSTTSAA